ncbi:MAG: T9SS type A sorting domain-containing protein [Bacteroidales bacterium]|nr:T9SS type A sorting domain-containing protein [Bacteroidales bacterium]
MKNIFTTLLFIFAFSYLNAQYSGSYTVGGTNPIFSTIAIAFDSLKAKGLAGPVKLFLRDGIYNEQVYLSGYFPNSSLTNTVTITSESGDSAAVLWTFKSNSSKNYNCYLNGSKYITFEKISLAAEDSVYSRIFYLNAGNTIKINNCVLTGKLTKTTNSASRLITTSSSTSLDLHNCKLIGADEGINSLSNPKITITNCSFIDQNSTAINVNNPTIGIISGNIIKSTWSTDFEGMGLFSCNDSLVVSNNHIMAEKYNNAIEFWTCVGSTQQPLYIINNYIKIKGSGTFGAAAFYLRNTENVIFANNTVVVYGSSNNTCLSTPFEGNRGIRIYNNNFCHLANGYLMDITELNDIDDCDFNNFFGSNSSRFIEIQEAGLRNLAQWQDFTGFDKNSINQNPLFLNDSTYKFTNTALSNAGEQLSYVNTDIEGDIRTSTPDIGADEWTGYSVNVEVTEISGQTGCGGSNNIYVTIGNKGNTPVTSLSLNWKVDNIAQTPLNWTGNLPVGSKGELLNLGSYAWQPATTYSIEVVSSLPNGVSDEYQLNDTLRTNYSPALSGTYTIGGISPDYITITQAVTALNNNGICGPVIFNIRDGVYNQRMALSSIKGTSGENTITFRSESGDSSKVTIAYSSSSSSLNYTIQIDNCNNIIFEDLTIKADGASYGRIVYFASLNYNIVFNRCQLIARSAAAITSSSYKYLVYISQTFHSAFRNSSFINGTTGLYINGAFESIIENCKFFNQYEQGMFLRWFTNGKVLKNQITSNTDNLSYRGLYVEYSYPLAVEYNSIGIGNGIRGIEMRYCNAPNADNLLKINNNTIALGGTSGTCYAVELYYSDFVSMNHNSVNLYREGSDNRCLSLDTYSAYLSLYNNILSNPGGGLVIATASLNGISKSDFNNFYTSGAQLGIFNGVQQPALADWQYTSKRDSNSFSLNPLFYSDTDLHACENTLKDKGKPISGITLDMDEEIRSQISPSIGADEFGFKDVIADTIRACQTVSVDAGNTDYSVLWSTGSSDRVITISPEGTFWVDYTNICGTQRDTFILISTGPTTYFNFDICEGDSIAVGGIYHSTAGNFSDTLTSVTGCDSIVKTTITVKPRPIINLSISICSGDSLFLQKSYRKTSGIYYDTLQTSAGCDSLIVNSLTVNNKYIVTTDESICSGDSIFLQGAYQKTAGTFTDSLITILGCDSIIITNLTLISIDATLQLINDTLFAVANGTYEWLDCDNSFSVIPGEIQAYFHPASSGNYALRITQNNCTSISDCYLVTITSLYDVAFKNSIKVYPNPASDKVNIELNRYYSNVIIVVKGITGMEYSNSECNNVKDIQVSLPGLQGMYFIEIKTDEGVSTIIKVVRD